MASLRAFKTLSASGLVRRATLFILPSILVLLYLTLTDKIAPSAESAGQSVHTLSYSRSDVDSSYYINDGAGSITYNFSLRDVNKRVSFSTAGSGNDVMVFLHIQKTGGTFFGKNLVRNLRLQNPCQCIKREGMLRCPCMNEDRSRYWLFSRYSTGWKCGLHADYTELTECLASGKLDELENSKRQRKYHYISVLRDPSDRFVSEWLHVNRGASWIDSTLRCNGRSPTAEELPPCYTGSSWHNVTLTQFIDCPHNLAINRQTRMLANLSLIGCYSDDMMTNEGKRRILLESAKHTLRTLPYFSIMSYINESQSLFERSFDIKFKTPLYLQKNRHNYFSSGVLYNLSPELRERVLQVNDLDLKLFNYARQLFQQRYQYAIKAKSKALSAYTPPY